MNYEPVIVYLAFGDLGLCSVWTCNLHCGSLLSLVAEVLVSLRRLGNPKAKNWPLNISKSGGVRRRLVVVFAFFFFFKWKQWFILEWKLTMAIDGPVTLGSVWLTLSMLLSSIWIQARGKCAWGAWVLSALRLPLLKQFPFSIFTKAKNLNLYFQILLFPVESISKGQSTCLCVSVITLEWGSQWGLWNFFPSKNETGSELARAAHWNASIALLGQHLLPGLNWS